MVVRGDSSTASFLRRIRFLGIPSPLFFRIIASPPTSRPRRPAGGPLMRKITLKPKPNRLAGLLERDLNPSQLAAATAPDGYNLILAGPGSGKTRVITYRVAHLIGRGRARRRDPARHLHTPGRPGNGRPPRRADRRRRGEGLGRHVPPRRQSDPPALRRAARLRPQLHDPRLAGPGRPRPPRHGRRRHLHDQRDEPQAVGRAALPELRLQRRPADRDGRRREVPEPVGLGRGAGPHRRAVRRAEARGQLHGLRRPARPVGAADPRLPGAPQGDRRIGSATS